MERQAAQEQQERLERERQDEDQRRLVREAEAAREQEQELARRNEEARRKEEEDRRLQAETAERQRLAAPSGDEAFDPYAVLGVPRDATFEAIRAAHEQARLKYDFEHVADLGFEIQQHYKTKAQAVNRAFQMLAESHQQTASC
jgi:hypothetical protein